LKLILDTHALIWWWNGDERLSERARGAISNDANSVFVSAASAWEMATKHRLGKLPDVASALPKFGELILSDGFAQLAVHWHHSLLAGQYAQRHSDPFDRMLAAQAQIESAMLVTRDAELKAFGIETYW
jgi:PIN domain nuclease of toxin-antitoxin system